MNAVLFIDGSNFYAGQYDLFGPHQYLYFPTFLSHIEEEIGITFQTVYFYASYSPQIARPTKKQQAYLKNESLFYKGVRRTKRVVFFKGYRSQTSGKEKEVDVKLAADMVHLGHLNEYDQMYLMTGDADFLQALFLIRSLRKRIHVLCIQNKIMHKGTIHFKTQIIKLIDKKISYFKNTNTSILNMKERQKKSPICRHTG